MDPNDGRVVSNFIVQALKGEPITIYGDGSQSRSFCYVDDLVDGLMKLMNTDDSVTGPINIGNPGEFTMLELAQQVLGVAREATGMEWFPYARVDVAPGPDGTPVLMELMFTVKSTAGLPVRLTEVFKTA